MKYVRTNAGRRARLARNDPSAGDDRMKLTRGRPTLHVSSFSLKR